MPSKDCEIISFEVPNGFRRRASVIRRLFRITLARMCRDGLEQQLEFYEERERLQKERSTKKKSTLETRAIPGRTLRRSTTPLGPTPLDPFPRDETPADPFDAIYIRHAKRIVPVVDDAVMRRLRVADAVREVKQHAPLTCPADEDIVAELQKRVVALLNSGNDEEEEVKPRKVKLESTDQSLTTFELIEQRLLRHIGIPVENDENVGREIDVSKVRTSGNVEPLDNEEDKEPSDA